MTFAPRITADPFAAVTRGIDEPHPARAALRAAGPLVQAEAPAGGPAWIVTDDALARRVLLHPEIVKDTACAPPGWNRYNAGLEPDAATQISLTTSDGPAHTRLRQAHAPLFTARRMSEYATRVTAHARDLLTKAAASGPSTDLVADFTTRFPLTVVCDVLGVPLDRVDQAITACRRMYGDPQEVGAAMAAFSDLAAAALEDGRDGLAAELRDRVPGDLTEADLHYLIFTLIFAGQLTTDPAVGFLLARLLRDGPPTAGAGAADDLVQDTLRAHAPAPFTLWRFTRTAIDLDGVHLPARSPILIDIQGGDSDLTFGAGPHYCTGAHLARLELRAIVDVLRTDFPYARLAVPYAELRQSDLGGIQASRLIALPVRLRG